MRILDLVVANGPNWIVAFVAVAGFWLSYRESRKAVRKIEQVRHETNSMRTQLEAAQFKDGEAKGRAAGIRQEQARQKE